MCGINIINMKTLISTISVSYVGKVFLRSISARRLSATRFEVSGACVDVADLIVVEEAFAQIVRRHGSLGMGRYLK